MSRPIRVCFVLTSSYGYFNTDVDVVGGGARQLSFVSQRLTDEFDVHFVVGDYGQPQTELRGGVWLHRAYEPSPDTQTYRKPLQLLKLFGAMRRANADVYVYRGRAYQAAILYALTQLLGRRWVYNLGNDSNIHSEPDELSPWMRHLFIRSLGDADAVISQTESQASALRAKYGTTSTVIPSGYPEAESIVPHDERTHFVWVGRLDADQKRPHRYLDLAARNPESAFRMIGPKGHDEDYNQQVLRRVAELDNLTYLGWLSPDEVHEHYRDAIALVNTSAYEGFPSTFLESWRYETPVLSLDVEVARFLDCATYAGDANGDFDRLKQLTTTLSTSPSERQRLSRPATTYFQENLTIEKVAQRYASLIRRVV